MSRPASAILFNFERRTLSDIVVLRFHGKWVRRARRIECSRFDGLLEMNGGYSKPQLIRHL